MVFGIAVAGLLHVILIVHSPVFIFVALTTTALGLVVALLRDGGDLDTSFRRHVLAAAAASELGPVMLMSLVSAHGLNRWQEAGLYGPSWHSRRCVQRETQRAPRVAIASSRSRSSSRVSMSAMSASSSGSSTSCNARTRRLTVSQHLPLRPHGPPDLT